MMPSGGRKEPSCPPGSSSWEPPAATSTTSTPSSARTPGAGSSPSPRPRSRTSTAAATRRSWPGPLYPEGIPIHPESDLPRLIRDLEVDQVVFAYSDVSHETVMHKASLVLACGADFRLIGPNASMLKAKVPVVSVCAVRTGGGKSQTTRRVASILRAKGRRVVAIRHPMPYGDLVKQKVQRFAAMEDLDRHQCTIEEREEYEPHIVAGGVIYAGVDYGAILAEAAEGGRRHPLGRRQQRPAVLPRRPRDRGGRPAPAGPRADLPPGRGEPAPRARRRDQQDRLRRARGHRGGAPLDPRAEPGRGGGRRRLAALRGRGRADPRQARPRGRGRADPDPRRDEVRRRRPRRHPPRRGRDRRPAAVHGGHAHRRRSRATPASARCCRRWATASSR